jgi:Tfp pilus assembly protein PilF
VLLVIGLGLYAADLNNVLFFDDEHLILNNVYVHELSWENVGHWFTENWFAGSGRISEYYRPLLLASFAGNYAVHGVEPFGYFFINNALHALNAVLVFWLLLLIFKKRWLAFVTALVFLVHPMQSENVAYVAGRGDLLASFFMLAGLIAWVRGVESGQRLLTWGLSSLFLILALCSRENAIIFPFLVAVLSIAFFSRENIWQGIKKALFHAAPYLFIVASYLALRLTVLNFRDFLNFGNYDTTSVYAQDILVRLYTFLHVLVEYLRTYVLPTNVHERFTFPIHESFFDWPVWISFLGIVALAVFLIVLYRTERAQKEKARGEQGDPSPFRVWFFAVGWFFVALVPSSGIIPTNVIIQDHRLYVALIGLTVLGLHYGWKGVESAKMHGLYFVQPAALVLVFAYLGFLSWITVERAIIWGKPIELFEETLRYEPNSPKALNQLGIQYLNQGDYKKAEMYFGILLQQFPNDADSLYNVGYVLQIRPKKDIDRAIVLYKKALEIDPGHSRTLRQLAEIYMERGDWHAVYYLRKLNELRPGDANIHYNLAATLHFLGENAAALEWVEEGLKLVADNTDAVKNFQELKNTILASL